MQTGSIQLVIIDPQNDFMDQPNAALPVAGASADMERLATLLRRIGAEVDAIHVTLDSHRPIDVAHPSFWVDGRGAPPPPFTTITHEDVDRAVWSPRGAWRERMLDYTDALERGGRYALTIWPEHCLLGSWGHNVVPGLKAELDAWERRRFATVDYVLKGLNAGTEHYGALVAEVPDPSDPSTALNTGLLSALQTADIVGIGGEASSHCVRATIEQIVAHGGPALPGKLHILTDCMSPVGASPGAPDFPALAAAFLQDMAARGLVLTTSERFLT